MPTKVASTSYIFPPRPTDAIPRDQTDTWGKLGWIAQYKYNDARCLIKFLPEGKVELWGRHGEKFRNYHTPDWLETELQTLHDQLGLDKNEWSLLDGGLLDFKHEAIRDTIVIWDILVQNGEHLLGTTYHDRYRTLTNALPNTKDGIPGLWMYEPPHKKHPPQNLGRTFTDHIFMPECWTHKDWWCMWEVIHMVNAPYLAADKGPVLEGQVLKDLEGTLGRGWQEKNNGDWMTRCRVTTGRHQF